MIRWIVIFALAAVAVPTACADSRRFDSWETRSAHTVQTSPYRQCFAVDGLATAIPPDAAAWAENLLERESAVAVDPSALVKIFPAKVPDAQSVSEAAAAAHEARATQNDLDIRSRQHVLSDEAQRLGRFESAQSRYFAQYLRFSSLVRKAFLVRAVALGETGGSFGITECDGGNTLVVSHGSLGRNWRTPERRPLLVFLMTSPKQVFVTTAMAE
jgi:hypothetical protein